LSLWFLKIHPAIDGSIGERNLMLGECYQAKGSSTAQEVLYYPAWSATHALLYVPRRTHGGL